MALLFVACVLACEPRPGREDADVGADAEPNIDAAFPEDDAGGDTNPACDCDDGIACTRDDCDAGACTHRPVHDPCGGDAYCDVLAGCVVGGACSDVYDCPVPGGCEWHACRSGRCTYWARDADADHEASPICGGRDCDDGHANAHPGGVEVCDGVDNDCDGSFDEEATDCAPGVCALGACRCPTPLGVCTYSTGSLCVDHRSDTEHCGRCGVTCGLASCIEGVCGCVAPETHCPSMLLCADLSSDAEHCGRCAHACALGACVEGRCVCPPGEVACREYAGELCADLLTNPRHCGACGRRCEFGERCEAGACVPGAQ